MKFYLSLVFFFCLTYTKGVISGSTEILRLHIQSDIRMRFATTQVNSLVSNNYNYSQEVTFNVNLPEEAFISSFKMVIDDVEYPGEVKEKEQAKKAYEKAKRRGQSAGHITKKPRATNKFKVNINVAALQNVTFELRYQELLKRRLGLYHHSIYVNPGQPVKDVKIQVYIDETKEIKTLLVPPVRSSFPSFMVETTPSGTNPDAVISRPSLNSAEILYIPKENESLNNIFDVKYDVARRDYSEADILAVNGYFVHFFAPPDLEPIPKDILFILDTSGSMTGVKIRQVIQAMKFIMRDLTEGDRFNLMDFDSIITFWRESMQPWNKETLSESIKWINKIDASGGTDINQALVKGLKSITMLSNSTSEGRSPIMVFLTDGAASSGETNGNRILHNIAKANLEDIPIFSLSFGADADFTLLQKISLQNNAVARRIYEASDTTVQLKNFYNEISAALMSGLSFTYLGNVDNDTLTTTEFTRYFNGTETVIAGKLIEKDNSKISWSLKASSKSGTFGIEETTDAIELSDEGKRESLLTDEDIRGIPEKLWAYLTIKQILDKITASENATEKEMLKEAAINLSLQYKFVTPVTSMVVIKPDTDEKENTDESLSDEEDDVPTVAAYRPGVGHAAARPQGGSYGDPHFLVKVKNVTHPLCFEMPAKKGEIMTLLSDPVQRFNVTAKIIAGTGSYKPGRPNRTYIGRVYIKTAKIEIMVAPYQILFNGTRYIWRNETEIVLAGASCEVNGRGKMVEIKVAHGLTFVIRRNLHAKMGPKYGYLDFFVINDKGLSRNVSGVIGHFIPMKGKITHIHKDSEGKIEATLRLTQPRKHYKKTVSTVLQMKRGLMSHWLPCWKVHMDKLGF